VGTPRVVALLTKKLEKSLLNPLFDLPLVAIPLSSVVDVEHLGEGLERGPLDIDDHQRLSPLDGGHESLRQPSVNIVLDLLD